MDHSPTSATVFLRFATVYRERAAMVGGGGGAPAPPQRASERAEVWNAVGGASASAGISPVPSRSRERNRIEGGGGGESHLKTISMYH